MKMKNETWKSGVVENYSTTYELRWREAGGSKEEKKRATQKNDDRHRTYATQWDSDIERGATDTDDIDEDRENNVYTDLAVAGRIVRTIDACCVAR